VLSGEWAQKRARSHARTFSAAAWGLLTEEQRETLVARFEPLYESHVAAMFERLARTMEVEPAQLEERRQAILARVAALTDTISRFRFRQEVIEQTKLGRQFTPELLAQLEERASEGELAEHRQPHVLGIAPDEIAFALISTQEVQARISGHAAAPADPDDALLDDAELVPLMPGLVVRRSEERNYPCDTMVVTLDRTTLPGPLKSEEPLTLELQGVGAHVLGWMGGRALGEDVDRRRAAIEEDAALQGWALVEARERGPAGERVMIDRGRYLPGDAIGRAGVEWSHEIQLRGLRGLRVDRLDTGEQQLFPPEPGRDVRLTLDMALQARVQAVLDPRFGLAQVHPWQGHDLQMPVGTPLNGAAVVVEVDSGDVLALVSTPEFSREQVRERPEEIFRDEINQPMVNRAIAVPYPPGSILKAMILTGAQTHGNIREGERIACTGHLYPNQPDMLRCWIYREQYGMTTHNARYGHDLNAVEALTVSCNIFFYTMGRRMGPRTIADTLREYGLGERWDLGIGPEFPGSVGMMHDDAAEGRYFLNDGSDLAEFDATLMGIGQGPVSWTPLHAASAYATLARMGVHITPRVVDNGRAPEIRETSFERRGIELALQGLDGVVNDTAMGTAYAITIDGQRERIFNAPGVHVWGKTGTATAPPLIPSDAPLDSNGKRIPAREGDHAWVTVLVGREGERPRYAISVIMEYAGSGGRVSGPLANQIIHALIAEGYL
jgi:cell division protein FtsI/penicillin-binding protein 2